MNCTVCHKPLRYIGGENKEDFGCMNKSGGCKSWDIQYYTHLGVRDGWYFATQYHLPFEWVDLHGRRPDHNFHWYALVGNGTETILQGLKLIGRECVQEKLHAIPYVALPANNDFDHQFNLLRDRMMNEWFDQYDDFRSLFNIVTSTLVTSTLYMPLPNHNHHCIPKPKPVISTLPIPLKDIIAQMNDYEVSEVEDYCKKRREEYADKLL